VWGGGRVKQAAQAGITILLLAITLSGPERSTEVLSKCGGKSFLNNSLVTSLLSEA